MAKHTIRDIAKMAGVSRSTVSLVLNNSPRVNEKTRRRVRETIARVGYRPSAQARGLASRRAGTVALIVPESDEAFRSFHLSDVIRGALSALAPERRRLVAETATRAFIRSRDYEALFQEQRIDGALIAVPRLNEPYVARMREAGYPLCLIDGEVEGVPSVTADNLRGARMAVRHLASLGHRDIACLRGPDSLVSGRDRYRGFVEGIEEAGLALRPERVAFGALNEYGGHEAMSALLRQGPAAPTALFAGSDMMALGAIERLREAGLSVPRDVAVVGADDILLASYCSPPLTTIRQPITDMARQAAQMLLDIIEGRDKGSKASPNAPSQRHTTIDAPLILRESCGARAANQYRISNKEQRMSKE